jgi:hypothetical protein
MSEWRVGRRWSPQPHCCFSIGKPGANGIDRRGVRHGAIKPERDDYALFPLGASDTLPGFKLRRLPISACERLGSAAFIALI